MSSPSKHVSAQVTAVLTFVQGAILRLADGACCPHAMLAPWPSSSPMQSPSSITTGLVVVPTLAVVPTPQLCDAHHGHVQAYNPDSMRTCPLSA